MNFAPSGALEPARHRLRSVAAALCVSGGLALGACSSLPAPTPAIALESAVTCTGRPDCPIELQFVAAATVSSAVADAELSADRPSVSYAFVLKSRCRLQWSLRGPAVRVTLASPDGEVMGPGLPRIVPLPAPGRYVFSISSNTMAEGIYGPFRLELQLLPAD